MSAVRHGRIDQVKHLIATEPDLPLYEDWALREAVFDRNEEMVRVLLEAGANVDAYDALCVEDGKMYQIVSDASRERSIRITKFWQEVERQESPLYGGTGLTFVNSGPEDIDALLSEATAEQEQMRFPTRAGARGRDYIALPQL